MTCGVQFKELTTRHWACVREVLPGLQLSHVGGDQGAPVSSLGVELLEAEALHQFVENAGGANRIEPWHGEAQV